MTASHAVTPTDTRSLPRGALNPANIASREHSAQVLNLALWIADSQVRCLVESYGYLQVVEKDGGGIVWLNVYPPAENDDVYADLDRALRYIGLRSPDAFPWRFLRHPDRPELVRFEDKP